MLSLLIFCFAFYSHSVSNMGFFLSRINVTSVSTVLLKVNVESISRIDSFKNAEHSY